MTEYTTETICSCVQVLTTGQAGAGSLGSCSCLGAAGPGFLLHFPMVAQLEAGALPLPWHSIYSPVKPCSALQMKVHQAFQSLHFLLCAKHS